MHLIVCVYAMHYRIFNVADGAEHVNVTLFSNAASQYVNKCELQHSNFASKCSR